MSTTPASTGPNSTPDPTKEIVRLQSQLATRLLLVFSLPFVVILILGVYAYQLSSRLKEVEALERVNFIERWYRDSRNLPWAIDQYQKLAHQHKRPQVLVRLANLYFERSKRVDRSAHDFDSDDVALAVRTLNGANELSVRNGAGEYWETYMTLTYIYVALAEKERDKDRKRELEKEAITAGEKALRLNHFDAQTYNNLAWVYATSESPEIRDLQKAQQFALNAVQQTKRRNADYLDTLAEVYRRRGQVTKGGEVLEEAIEKQARSTETYLEERKRPF